MRIRASFAIGLSALFLLLLAPFVGGSAAGAYPITTCSTLAVSTTNPRPGEAITVTGSNFEPNSSVTLVLTPGGTKLGTATSDSGGAFSTQVTLPDSATNNGHFDIVATTGFTGTASCPVDPFQNLAIQAETDQNGGGGSGTGANAGGSSGGGLSVTGLDVAGLLALAAALIGTGVVLNRKKTRVGGR